MKQIFFILFIFCLNFVFCQKKDFDIVGTWIYITKNKKSNNIHKDLIIFKKDSTYISQSKQNLIVGEWSLNKNTLIINNITKNQIKKKHLKIISNDTILIGNKPITHERYFYIKFYRKK